jgi:hypothetical protein
VVRASAQPDGEVTAWRGPLKPHGGQAAAHVTAHFRVRAMPVPDGGLAPLCWLVRRTD